VLSPGDYSFLDGFTDTERNQAKAAALWKGLTGFTGLTGLTGLTGTVFDGPPLNSVLIKEGFVGRAGLVYRQEGTETKWVYQANSVISYTLSFVIKIPKSTDRGIRILGSDIDSFSFHTPDIKPTDVFINAGSNSMWDITDLSHLPPPGISVDFLTDSAYKIIKIYWDAEQTDPGFPVDFNGGGLEPGSGKHFSAEGDDYILPIAWG
jgi:hypothetical protein